jgi:hypothetical protein
MLRDSLQPDFNLVQQLFTFEDNQRSYSLNVSPLEMPN